MVRIQLVWTYKIWTSLQVTCESSSLSKSIERIPLTKIMRSSHSGYRCSFAVVTQDSIGHSPSSSWRVSYARSMSHQVRWCRSLFQHHAIWSSQKFIAPLSSPVQLAFSSAKQNNKSSLSHFLDLVGLLGDVLWLTVFCSGFCNGNNMVCFHHFVARASKKCLCYLWMGSSYSLYLIMLSCESSAGTSI